MNELMLIGLANDRMVGYLDYESIPVDPRTEAQVVLRSQPTK